MFDILRESYSKSNSDHFSSKMEFVCKNGILIITMGKNYFQLFRQFSKSTQFQNLKFFESHLITDFMFPCKQSWYNVDKKSWCYLSNLIMIFYIWKNLFSYFLFWENETKTKTLMVISDNISRNWINTKSYSKKVEQYQNKSNLISELKRIPRFERSQSIDNQHCAPRCQMLFFLKQ